MHLPVNPPVAPMLAKPVDAIPGGDYIFEPKWDGFRCLVFRDGNKIELQSKSGQSPDASLECTSLPLATMAAR